MAGTDIALATLYVGWLLYLASREPAGLAGVADLLAAAVGRQWRQEAAALRLNDPFPLPVRWVAADPSLVDDWQTVVMLAAGGAGMPAKGQERADGPGDLAGEGAGLAGVLSRVPTGRLVVLGEPGSGKTVLMIRLVLELLVGRDGGGPVPVLVSVASWNPAGQELRGWLEAQVSRGYPWLAGPAPHGHGKVSWVRALLDQGLIMPVLDGLDEIPAGARALAVAAINDAVRPGERLVVTSRTAQWQDAVCPPAGIEVRLRGAAGIVLCPLDADVVAVYLRADAGGPVAAARWDRVLTALRTQPFLAQVLSSPLMVGLARMVYNPRPGENPAALPDPADLCRLDARARLLAAWIPAAYRGGQRHLAGRSPVSPEQAGKWLAFLARHLEHTVKTPDIAWWQIIRALPPRWSHLIPFTVGCVCGTALAPLAGLGNYGYLGTQFVGTLWFYAFRDDRQPSYGISWTSVRRLGLAWFAGLAALATALAAVVIFLSSGVLKNFLFQVLALSVVTVVAERLKGGLPGDLAPAPSPRAVLVRDRRTGFAVMLPIVLLCVAASVLLRHLLPPYLRYAPAVLIVQSGLAGAGIGVGISGFVSAWPRWAYARAFLALRRQLPWRLMAFLADARQRGVLRQDGAVYQFRHIELQRWLAARPQPAPPRSRLARGR